MFLSLTYSIATDKILNFAFLATNFGEIYFTTFHIKPFILFRNRIPVC